MKALMVTLVAFTAGAGVVALVAFVLVRLPEILARRRVETRLFEDGANAHEEEAPTLIKRAKEGPLPSVDRLLAGSRRGSALTRFIEQSGVRASVSALLLVAVFIALALALAAAIGVHAWWAPFVGGVIGLAVPFGIINRRRRARLRRFEEQFPDALDLLARAIRAGHAFTTALGMVADEGADPVGLEFRKTYDEQNFGLPLQDALANLAARVPLLDVRFFATAVLIQRETGGNLSEILENLARVVRERFKVLRQVRVYTAHGRFTGYVLMALPAALAVILSIINPDHMMVLFKERMGQMMLGSAIVMQIVGYLWIKHIVKIEV